VSNNKRKFDPWLAFALAVYVGNTVGWRGYACYLTLK
jgi:hypothetical protein